MNEKLFQKLKTTYAALGLGDALLKAQADALCNSGLATEENLDSLVAALKGTLETIQRTNDKRVTDAMQQQKEKLEKERAEEVEKLKAELEAIKNPTPKPLEQPVQPAGIPDWFKAAKEESDKKMAEVLNANKTLSDALFAMKKENDEFKAAQATQKRNDFIAKVSKELGIPQWRQDEGFNIAADANDEAITEYLTKVSNNIKAQTLPTNGIGLPMGAGGKVDKETLNSLASSIVKNA